MWKSHAVGAVMCVCVCLAGMCVSSVLWRQADVSFIHSYFSSHHKPAWSETALEIFKSMLLVFWGLTRCVCVSLQLWCYPLPCDTCLRRLRPLWHTQCLGYRYTWTHTRMVLSTHACILHTSVSSERGMCSSVQLLYLLHLTFSDTVQHIFRNQVIFGFLYLKFLLPSPPNKC